MSDQVEQRLVSSQQAFTLRQIIDRMRQDAARLETLANILEGVMRDERVPQEVREGAIRMAQPYSTLIKPLGGA